MADKRISQLVDRGTVANNDVVPIVVNGAVTTNKATISSIQTFMQGNLDLGVTSVGITLGSSGTDVSVSGSPVTSSGNITINLPTASATNRGLLSAADWSTFNGKANAADYVTLATAQTITGQKTFTASGGSDSVIISTSGAGFSLDAIKSGNGEVIRVNKTSGTGNAMTVIGGNFEAPTIVKTGGTSSQFLKADGSVDSNTYVTTDTTQSISGVKTFNTGSLILAAAGTANSTHIRNSPGDSTTVSGSNAFGFNKSNNIYVSTQSNGGFILNFNNTSSNNTYTLQDADGTLAFTSQIPSVAGVYLPLAGGTLTGALNGTSATFTGDATVSSSNSTGIFTIGNRSGNNAGIFKFASSTTATNWIISNNAFTTNALQFTPSTAGGGDTYTTPALTLASTGIATFSGGVGVASTYQNWDGSVFKGIQLGTSYAFVMGRTDSALNQIMLGTNAYYKTDGNWAYINSSFASRYYQTNGEHIFEKAVSGTAANNITWVNSLTITSDTFLRMGSGTGGIQFNGDTASANALDDYEEGTWTPVIGGDGGESGQTYSGQTGNYTKVGSLVTATFRVVLSNKGTITGSAAIKGLPFTISATISHGSGVTYFEGFSTSWSSIFLMANGNTTYATIDGVKVAATATTRATTSDIGNSTQFNGSITYLASS